MSSTTARTYPSAFPFVESNFGKFFPNALAMCTMSFLERPLGSAMRQLTSPKISVHRARTVGSASASISGFPVPRWFVEYNWFVPIVGLILWLGDGDGNNQFWTLSGAGRLVRMAGWTIWTACLGFISDWLGGVGFPLLLSGGCLPIPGVVGLPSGGGMPVPGVATVYGVPPIGSPWFPKFPDSTPPSAGVDVGFGPSFA